MTNELKLFFTFLLLFKLSTALGQKVSRNELSNIWNSNLKLDSLNEGDTIFFTKNNNIEKLQFKSNGELMQFNIDSNHSTITPDSLIKTKREWITIGEWNLDSTMLNLVIYKGKHSYNFLHFEALSSKQNQLKFIFIGSMPVRDGRGQYERKF